MLRLDRSLDLLKVGAFILTMGLMAIGAAGCGGGARGPTSGGMISKDSRVAGHLKMGGAFLNIGDYNSALAEISKADLLDPNNAEVNFYLGQIYFRRDEFPQAIERFQKVLAIDPTRTETHNNLGLVYLSQRDFAKARSEFEICLKDPTYSQVHLAQFNLGLLEESEGNLAQAEAIYLKVVNSKQMPQAYYRLGQLALNRGEANRAVDYLLPAVKVSPTYADAYFALALAYERQGLNDEAAEAYGQVVNLTPNTSRAIDAQKRVRRLLGFQ